MLFDTKNILKSTKPFLTCTYYQIICELYTHKIMARVQGKLSLSPSTGMRSNKQYWICHCNIHYLTRFDIVYFCPKYRK